MAEKEMCLWHKDRPAVDYCAHCGTPVCDECHTGSYCNRCIKEPPKRKSIVLLLALFLGWLGVHRYYMRFYFTGVLYTLTLGLLGIGWVIDVIRILSWSTISKKQQPYYISDHSPYCTVGIKIQGESLVEAFASVAGDRILEGMSSNERWLIENRFWRDKHGRPLLRIGMKSLT